MLTHPKNLVWGASNFEEMLKNGLRNVADVYLKSCKNQSKGGRYLKYGLK